MSKKKILKGLTDHIKNTNLCIIDFEISGEPSPNKHDSLEAMWKDYNELNDIKDRLEEILIG